MFGDECFQLFHRSIKSPQQVNKQRPDGEKKTSFYLLVTLRWKQEKRPAKGGFGIVPGFY